ncbi:MgtC/SapB family protein [Aquabacterium humicola]|uniref:MgtC/SapB family protein n=1 Tax=Aquabacterium humicola TaxID=3237377 RepID=UPI002543418A|nr:DUF4010 domain-containing protein [Rubrivivax pictus]
MIDASLALLAALAVGLIIGLERGWRGRELAAGGRVAGLRTFALVGLLGGVLGALVGPAGAWPLAAGVLALAALNVAAYRESVRASGSLSATTAVAQMLTLALGALATLGQPVAAVACAVVAAALLDLRSTLHRWLRQIEQRELNAALQMLVLSLVVLPLLPDRSFGPIEGLNPYRLWWAVVLVAGLSLCGHVAMRATGAQHGLLWTGLLGGLASSTAATLALARRQRADPALREAASAGALCACAVMFVRVALLLLSVAPALAAQLIGPLLAAAALLLVAGLRRWRRRGDAPEDHGSDLPPFELGTALGFGAYLALVTVLVALARDHLGSAGLVGSALVAGLADVDAITISLARLQAAGGTPASTALLAIGAALLSNLVAKAAMARAAGGPAFGRAIAAGYAGAGAAAAGIALLAWR